MFMIRFIAEWEPQDAVLLALPHEDTDWAYMLGRARDQYRRLVGALTSNGVHAVVLCRDPKTDAALFEGSDKSLLTLIQMDFNDTWTRDYGPIAVMKDDRIRALDFGFNGWGLKFASDKDNLVNQNLRDICMIKPEVYRKECDFILEGGSVETDGCGTLLTTSRCLCSPNRNGGLTRGELNEILMKRLGVSHVLWLDYGALEGDDTDSHIDTLARMAPGNTILFTGCRNMDDPHFEELLKMRAQLSVMRTAEGEAFNLVELPLPDPVYDDDGNRLPATYANYLVTDHTVFMPSYGQPHNDELACQTVRIAYPCHKVVSVDCTALLCQHGSLHCATMQIHKNEFSFITANDRNE